MSFLTWLRRLKRIKTHFFIVTGISLLWIFVSLSCLIQSYNQSADSSHDYDIVVVAGEAAKSVTVLENSEQETVISAFDHSFAYQQLHAWQPVPFLKRKSKSKAGHNGRGLNFTANQVREMKSYPDYGFNVIASDLIPVDRILLDTRDAHCFEMQYPDRLPDASVIITFYNEAESVLFRTITSVMNTSPGNLLREIILVDDASDDKELGTKLSEFLRKISLTMETDFKLIRLSERSGLIKARLAGVDEAAGQVLVFLDSHVECMIGWLEPLLSRITSKRTRVVAPAIDTIHWYDFSYHMTHGKKVGGFNWNLDYRWIEPDVPLSSSEPIPTPVIAGGLFAIDKKLFNQIGSYDTGMMIWGGENIEMSVRVWTCGGSLEIIPCSHVGHVFREKNPYLSPADAANITRHNKYRFAAVWMDRYMEYYMAMRTSSESKDGHGDEDDEDDDEEVSDVSERLELRRRLQCKSFNWYLHTIYPFSHYPKAGEITSIGVIKTDDLKFCITANKKVIQMIECPERIGFKMKFALQENELRNNLLCLKYKSMGKKVIMQTCNKNNPSAKWSISADDSVVRMTDGRCLALRVMNGTVVQDLTVSDCVTSRVKLIFETIIRFSL